MKRTTLVEAPGQRMLEADLLRGVLDLARLFGWRTAHFRPCRTAHGWATAVQGDGVGFPDLVLLRDRVIVAELKAGGKPTPDQLAWLAAFASAGVPAYLWTPADYPERIAEVLR